VADEKITVDRDYIDTFSIKDIAATDIMPKFFPDVDTSNLTTGTFGMVAEYMGTITEDAFNAGSSLLSEVFPTRSKMKTSIYSNAAIFQLTDMVSDCGRCDFLVLLAEADVRANFVTTQGSDYSYFYIDKDTVIRVGADNIPFSLDYDIEIKGMYSESRGKWIYSAKYMVEEYTNSVSNVSDPYIRMAQYDNGMLVMKLELGQYVRTIEYDTLVDNATLNYPTVDVSFSDQILGFDVLYKAPGDSDYNTQLAKKVIYSVPSKDPFCYYKMIDDSHFEISFTTKDSYFQPKFNSELKIIVYTTLGSSGNFDYYDGETYNITKGEAYDYSHSWLIAAKSTSGSSGGKDMMTIDGLKNLTVEGFTTANSLSTENDLQTYFRNYKYRNNNEVLFIKKRNDAVELLFSAFMYVRNGDYTYPTNTLYLDTNIKYFDYKTGGNIYNLDPGYLFTYKTTPVYREHIYYTVVDGEGEKYDVDGNYYDKDGVLDESGKITLRELNKRIGLGGLEKTEQCYWKASGNTFYYYHENDSVYTEVEPITEQELAQKYDKENLIYDKVYTGATSVDFAMDQEKEAQTRKDYYNYYEEYKVKTDKPDLSFDDYIFDYTFKDYQSDLGIDNRLSVFNTDVETYASTVDFLFTNPYIITVAEDSGLVSYYQSFINNNSALDYVSENSGQSFVQFITYTLNVSRDVTDEKKYNIKIVTMPSNPPTDYADLVSLVYDEKDASQFIQPNEGELEPSLRTFNKDRLVENNLRMVLTFTYKSLNVGYMELIPTNVDKKTDQITYEGCFYTDDYISASNTIRITHICPYCGHEILNSVNDNNDEKMYYCDNCKKNFQEGIINMRTLDTLELPIEDCLVTLTSLYRDPEKDEPVTDNDFLQYSDSYVDYMWTNIYSTTNEPISLMEPLEMLRSSITYSDYYEAGIDAFDCNISDIPLIKYSIIAYNDEGPKQDDPLVSEDIGKFDYFMDAFKSNYDVLREAKDYLNGMHIDCKFYNSYGRSTNFDIGEDGELIDTNNISIYFDVHTITGTDIITAEDELKTYIKSYIEDINTEGSNNLYISNLIRSIEDNFTYVHHLRFTGINNYDSSYQAIINTKISLDDLTKDERRKFVPDILVINRNNIYLSFFTDTD
jgi:predicted RNA-binding Zn-ribbon protein involved in translation (DUF1610 family)